MHVEQDYSILDSIGNTPVVRLRHLAPERGAAILVKLEGSNPGGSVKDRVALWMVRRAEEEGFLKRGKTILEATSGNTGIGLALVGATLGYRVKFTVPENVSAERSKLCRRMELNLLSPLEREEQTAQSN